jgi:hypothetical protein
MNTCPLTIIAEKQRQKNNKFWRSKLPIWSNKAKTAHQAHLSKAIRWWQLGWTLTGHPGQAAAAASHGARGRGGEAPVAPTGASSGGPALAARVPAKTRRPRARRRRPGRSLGARARGAAARRRAGSAPAPASARGHGCVPSHGATARIRAPPACASPWRASGSA